ncbi:transcriptional regulator NrdR, partial [Streptococcus agalactiae]|nr:transcriptional regulator NrdR [Streptococcus agalactiae]MDE7498935.1 transcriptional regulator NrdR [Streptococcus agalactiae]
IEELLQQITKRVRSKKSGSV